MKSVSARISILIATACAVTFSGCLCILTGNSVTFNDRALESAVRASIGKYFGCLTENDLLEVREIQASALNIRDLTGLEKCLNLTTLNLRSNQISSVTALNQLTQLNWLDLGDNSITNITPLSGLFFLQFLDLQGEGNDIRDFGPLVANAQAGGLGEGDTVTLSPEFTLDSEGQVVDEFQDEYDALRERGVTVIFAESDGTETRS